MVRRTARIIFLFVAIILFAGCVPAQDAQSAKTFLTGIYEKYQHGGKGIDFTGPTAGDYYHPSLLLLIHEDIKANGPDNVPAIDFDPICGCQDWGGVWGLTIDVSVESPQKATSQVSFALDRSRTKESLRKLVITLVPERGQWRIYDLVDDSDPKNLIALRKLLSDDIREIRKNKAAVPTPVRTENR